MKLNGEWEKLGLKVDKEVHKVFFRIHRLKLDLGIRYDLDFTCSES